MRRHVAVKPDFRGQISIFESGITKKILYRDFLKFGTFVYLTDVNFGMSNLSKIEDGQVFVGITWLGIVRTPSSSMQCNYPWIR